MLHAIYDRTLRPALKRLGLRKANRYNDIEVPEQAITDRVHHYDYKPAAVAAIREAITPGDTVLEIAAGRGAFSVEAALAGADVLAYEASAPHARLARLTAARNGVGDSVTVEHVLVGERGAAHRIYGRLGAARSVHPRELPERDVLLLDCEGVEVAILRWMRARPERVLVETHPDDGAKTERVVDLLADIGYRIEDCRPMDTPDGGAFVVASLGG